MGYKIKLTLGNGEEVFSTETYTYEEAEERVAEDYESDDLGWIGNNKVMDEEIVEE